MVYSTRYHSGRPLAPSGGFNSAQQLAVYNPASCALDDNEPADYTYARTGQAMMPLPTMPFISSSLPPQVRIDVLLQWIFLHSSLEYNVTTCLCRSRRYPTWLLMSSVTFQIQYVVADIYILPTACVMHWTYVNFKPL